MTIEIKQIGENHIHIFINDEFVVSVKEGETPALLIAEETPIQFEGKALGYTIDAEDLRDLLKYKEVINKLKEVL